MVTEIPLETARLTHGITTRHEVLPGGELRFRLIKNDGTAYVRTEAPPLGGWQESHFHRSVRETYIVQSGWVAWARLQAGAMNIAVAREGESFTIPPATVHTIYMSAGSVVHTVKHGAASGPDRVTDPMTAEMDRLVATVTEAAILQASPTTAPAQTLYNEEYRHFDTLIWQLPAWSTAVFIGLAATMSQLTERALGALVPGVDAAQAFTGFLLLVLAFLGSLTHALHRFRMHQSKLKRYPPTKPWVSASTQLQAIVTTQAAAVLWLVLVRAGVPPASAVVLSLLSAAGVVFYRERALRRG